VGIFQKLIDWAYAMREPRAVVGVQPFAHIAEHEPRALFDGAVVPRARAVRITIERMGKRWCLHPEYTPLRRPRRLKAW